MITVYTLIYFTAASWLWDSEMKEKADFVDLQSCQEAQKLVQKQDRKTPYLCMKQSKPAYCRADLSYVFSKQNPNNR